MVRLQYRYAFLVQIALLLAAGAARAEEAVPAAPASPIIDDVDNAPEIEEKLAPLNPDMRDCANCKPMFSPVLVNDCSISRATCAADRASNAVCTSITMAISVHLPLGIVELVITDHREN